MALKAPPTHFPGIDTPLEYHPFSLQFPEAEQWEILALARSIQEYGQLLPIAVYQDKILDGRARYKAIADLNQSILSLKESNSFLSKTLKREPIKLLYGRFEYGKTNADKLAKEFVIANNLYRRHLSGGTIIKLFEGQNYVFRPRSQEAS